MLSSEMLWNFNITAALVLGIFASGCDFAGFDYGYDDDDDYVAGTACYTNSDCKNITGYCCLIQNRRHKLGYCNYRGLEGDRCSNMLYRTVANNNYDAPYLYVCPCVQPKYTCHRKHGLATYGKCQFYTNARPGGWR
ncbi:hypothetical protein MTO96_052317 [Rhipicephalus appendiculatus]